MEKELNIAAILKDKPKGLEFFDSLMGENVIFDKAGDNHILCSYNGNSQFYKGNGKLFDNKDAIVVLTPSRNMRDWSKFAWKKGDVLTNTEKDFLIIFDHFENNEYTSFCGKYAYDADKVEWFEKVDSVKTEKFKKGNNDVTKSHILDIEVHWKGKLNLETLTLEHPKPEFKDGDILVTDEIEGEIYAKCVFILRKDISYIDEYTHYYAFHNINDKRTAFNNTLYDKRVPRPATDSEKQQLFDALAKENKHWNPDTKQIEDLPKKCEFKPFDKCVWKIQGIEGYIWQASFISYIDEYDAVPIGVHVDDDLANLIVLPYNDQTKHLLGTTDEWKGGEL